jgi:hypothetical protein
LPRAFEIRWTILHRARRALTVPREADTDTIRLDE